MKWLFKEEPTHYSYDEFVKDEGTVWEGVKNPVAQKHLRSVKKGDSVFYYHTGKEKAVVGIAKAVGNAYVDPKDKTGKRHVVDIVPRKKLKRPVTLKEIKAPGARSRRSLSPASHASRPCRSPTASGTKSSACR